MTSNSDLRSEVRERAKQCCEYYLRSDEDLGYRFHVDHIIAKKHSGTSELSNLAWSCFQCNIFKGTDIASYDVQQLTPLYNPRTQKWDDHFEKDDLYLRGKTAVRRVTGHILKLNHRDHLKMRETMKQLGLW